MSLLSCLVKVPFTFHLIINIDTKLLLWLEFVACAGGRMIVLDDDVSHHGSKIMFPPHSEVKFEYREVKKAMIV